MQKMYFFITIANRAEDKEFFAICEKENINNVYSTPAHGTASLPILDLLGLAESEKTVHISLLMQSKVKKRLEKTQKMMF